MSIRDHSESQEVYPIRHRTPVIALPVEIELTQHHPYRKGTRGCAACNQAKTHRDHLGAPPSLNVFASNGHFVYRAYKKAWQELLVEAIGQTNLPKGLSHVLAEGECTFPTRIRRDQGNARFMPEKALGDALVQGGWLRDDAWEFYEFGGLAARYEAGVSRTRLLIFPTLAAEEVAA